MCPELQINEFKWLIAAEKVPIAANSQSQKDGGAQRSNNNAPGGVRRSGNRVPNHVNDASHISADIGQTRVDLCLKISGLVRARHVS